MALSQAEDHAAPNLPGLGLCWMISKPLIIGMEDLEERGWKSGRGQREGTSDVSSDQEIICLSSREKKSDLSPQEGEGRDSHGVSMCLALSKCPIDARDPQPPAVMHLARSGKRLNLALWIPGQVCALCGRCPYACVVYFLRHPLGAWRRPPCLMSSHIACPQEVSLTGFNLHLCV